MIKNLNEIEEVNDNTWLKVTIKVDGEDKEFFLYRKDHKLLELLEEFNKYSNEQFKI